MADRELIELIRHGVSSWRGTRGSAADARYAADRPWIRWRYSAVAACAVVALLMLAASLAGGPGPAVQTFVIGTTHSAGQVATPAPSSSPSAAAAPVPAPKSQQPAPPVKVQPAPTSKPEPTAVPVTPSPEVHASPSPSPPHPEASPTPTR